MAWIDLEIDYEEALREANMSLSHLPEGVYEGEIVRWETTVSSKGTRQIQWEIDIVDKPKGFENFPSLKYWTSTEGRGRYFLTKFAQACQLPWLGTRIDPDAYIGKRLWIYVTTGEKYSKIEAIAAHKHMLEE